MTRAHDRVRYLRWLLIALFVVYAAWLTPPFLGEKAHPNDARDLWLYFALSGLTIVVTSLRAVLVREDRLAWAMLALGSAFWVGGDVWYLAVVQFQSPVPTPSWADAGYLALYPPVWFAIILLLRRQARALPAGVWMDGLVGGLAAAALVSAVVLRPILAATGGSVANVATNLSYPTGDILLLSLVVGIYAMFGWHPNKMWLLLGGGLLAFTLTDTDFLFQSASNTYTVGTTWDAGWPLGLLLVALAAWRKPGDDSRQVNLAGSTALLLPLLCGMLGLGLLAYGCLAELSLVSVILASACVLGALLRTVLTFRELQALAQARREAATDDLTGLANRRLFYARLGRDLADRPRERHIAVMLVDLDRFKEVNDSLGHHVGDLLLQLVGKRLVRTLREGDLLARLGGDEFAAMVHIGGEIDAAETVAQRMRDVLQDPFVVEGTTMHIDASIGIALSVDHGGDAETLLRHADIAMYEAKTKGGGWRVYSLQSDQHITDRLANTEALRTALSSGHLVLHYQPKLELATGVVTGVEALVRWQHPERGLVFPDDFLPLAEAAGLMPALTRSVLEQALRQCAAWRSAGRDLHVAVNLSPSNLLDPDLADHIMALLARFELPTSALHLEITEQMIMIDPERSLAVLRLLHAYGLRLAIDDYGAGYSSLTYLTALPVADLKLDKSFVIAMAGEGAQADRAEAIVQSTVRLAEALGLDLIAEGVETAEVLDKLVAMGCTMAQGYYLARPQPAGDLERWLDNQPALTRASVA
jgi:diguanylate cyclase (GGDEF)-like protein